MQVLQLGQALSAQTLAAARAPAQNENPQARGQNGAAKPHEHAFWGTQPVVQFTDDPGAVVGFQTFEQ